MGRLRSGRPRCLLHGVLQVRYLEHAALLLGRVKGQSLDSSDETMIRLNATAIGLGMIAGIVFGIITALAFMLLIPEARFSYWEWAALPSLVVWAIFMGLLPGVLLGGLFGAAAGALVSR